MACRKIQQNLRCKYFWKQFPEPIFGATKSSWEKNSNKKEQDTRTTDSTDMIPKRKRKENVPFHWCWCACVHDDIPCQKKELVPHENCTCTVLFLPCALPVRSFSEHQAPPLSRRTSEQIPRAFLRQQNENEFQVRHDFRIQKKMKLFWTRELNQICLGEMSSHR